MYKVACLGTYHPKGMELLNSRPDLFSYVQELSTAPEDIARAVAGVDAIVVRTQPLPKTTLEKAPNLKIVSRHGVGYDNVDMDYMNAHKIPMALAVDSNMVSVAEHTMMMMLALAKDAFRAHRETCAGNYAYRDKRTSMDLVDTSILIMGFGRIGQCLARLCNAFGMHIFAYDPFVTESPVPNVMMLKDFHECLGKIDFLSMHLPSTPETCSMIGPNEIKMMKKGVIVVNCARGGVLNEDMLCDGLESGQIGGVGLDVFAKEPPDVRDRIFNMDRVIVSPHNAAITDASAMRMATQSIQNVIDCLEGKLEKRVIANWRELGL